MSTRAARLGLLCAADLAISRRGRAANPLNSIEELARPSVTTKPEKAHDDTTVVPVVGGNGDNAIPAFATASSSIRGTARPPAQRDVRRYFIQLESTRDERASASVRRSEHGPPRLPPAVFAASYAGGAGGRRRSLRRRSLENARNQIRIGGGWRLSSGTAFVLRADIAWLPDASPVGGYVVAGELFSSVGAPALFSRRGCPVRLGQRSAWLQRRFSRIIGSNESLSRNLGRCRPRAQLRLPGRG